jgi:hypothetical protein
MDWHSKILRVLCALYVSQSAELGEKKGFREWEPLYMAAVCASKSNPILREFYIRLVEENHRPKKVALVAVMRKMLIAANSAIRNADILVAT